MGWLSSKEPSKDGDQKSNAKAEARRTDADRIYALLRRLRHEINELDTKVSTCRRDINRIDRKGYREAEQLPPHLEVNEEKPHNGDRQSLMGLFNRR